METVRDVDQRTYICPLCGEERRLFLYFTIPAAGYAYCPDCLIAFTDWSNINQTDNEEKDIRGFYFNYKDESPCIDYTARIYLPRMDEWLNKTQGKKLLDIGFAHPAVLDFAKKIGYETYGIDINNHPSDKNSPHHIIIGDFEETGFDNKFDVIWASQVFEHFNNPIDMLDKCYNLLNKNGLIFIGMPNLFYVPDDDILGFGHWNPKEHHIMWQKTAWEKRMINRKFTIKFSEHNNNHCFTAWMDFHIIGQKNEEA